MKKKYTAPECLIIFVEGSEGLMAASGRKEGYEIGGPGSQWPENGDIKEDNGNGPGVSGAKGHSFLFDED